MKIKYNMKIEDYGELYTLEQFEQNCKDGYFTDDDGSGYYSDGKEFFVDKPTFPSDFRTGKINIDFEYVMWFNK